MSVQPTLAHPTAPGPETGGAAGATSDQQLLEKMSGTFWRCVGVFPMGSSGPGYVFGLKDAYDISSCTPEEQTRKIQLIQEQTRRIFPALEFLAEELKIILTFPTTYAEMSSYNWQLMLNHYVTEVLHRNKNPDNSFKEMLQLCLPKDLEVESLYKEMLDKLGVKSLSDEPSALSERSGLCAQTIDRYLQTSETYNKQCKQILMRNKENNQIIRDIGISLRQRDGKWILTSPGRQALIHLWGVQRKKHPRLPPLDICASNGKAGDLEFLKSNARGQVVLSNDKEFMHDLLLHVIIRIVLILKNSGINKFCINEYLKQYQSLASRFITIIDKSEESIGEDDDSLLTRDEHSALTTLLASIIDSIAANRNLDPYIINGTPLMDIANEQIAMEYWSEFLKRKFENLSIRGASENKLKNLVSKLGEVMSKLEVKS